MKKLLAVAAIMLLAGSCAFAFGGKKGNDTLELVPVMNYKTEQQNRVWVGTFQLVWNDFMDYIVKGPVVFENEKSPLAKQLNKQKFKADMLNENSYYKAYGAISPELKTQIESGIKEKFNETSDILNSLDWNPAPEKYLVYAMLKKDFKFITAFDKLKPARFGNSRAKVEYFGIDKNSDEILDKTVHVLFYNSVDDFAISINTQTDDILYLYRTSDDKPFDKLYSDMNMKKAGYTGFRAFNEKDVLKVPNLSLFKEQSYPQLCNKPIKNTKMMISDAMQTVDFKMDNEGVKLKSEAAIATVMSALPVFEKPQPRKFYLDDTFVLFLQEGGKKLPYFALRVNDVDFVNKTGRK